MTMPQEIELASKQFGDLLGELKQRALLETRNQCYAMMGAVLHEFRDHLSTAQAIAFADGLPPLVCAIFVTAWRPGDEPVAFTSRQAFSDAVVRRLSPHHFPPASLVADVFALLAPRLDSARSAAVIDELPNGLRELFAGPKE